MRLSADAKPKLEVVLDALASKLGIVSAVGLLFGICFGVALYLQSVVNQLEKDHEVFAAIAESAISTMSCNASMASSPSARSEPLFRTLRK